MKKIIVFGIILISLNSKSQISKGNWLAGGQILFNTENQGTLRRTDFNLFIRPSIGHFILNKLALGINADYWFYKSSTPTIPNTGSISVGPFIRYYLLKDNGKINILSEIGVKFFSDFSTFHTLDYNLSVGPVLFLNENIGIEFLISSQKYTSNSGIEYLRVLLSAGLQIHLQRESN